MKNTRQTKKQRQAGILISITSIPGPFDIGDLGPDTLRFLDKLQESRISVLSILPANPTSFGNSPYQSPSAFAGNYYFISPQYLFEDGLLTRKDLEEARCLKIGTVDYGRLFETRVPLLRKAFQAFQEKGGLSDINYKNFCQENADWMDNFAAFMTLKEAMGYQPWNTWPPELAFRKEPGYSRWIAQHQDSIAFWKFTQFCFFSQWNRLKEYANQKGIEIIGDMPFYVAADSADVWGNPELFALDPATGKARLWAGVPADDFSGHDRNWGNPVYDWKLHKSNNYAWFRRRIRLCGAMYNSLRIDHAIAIKRYFGIKDGEAVGSWYDGPEMQDTSLTDAIQQEASQCGMSIIVEDLGKVPDGLRERMQELGWPGMRLLQFAFTGKYGAGDNHLPFYHRQDMIVYTGTHDNPTLKEFLEQKTDEELRYMAWWTHKASREELHHALIEEAFKSPANLVIIPLQDLLGLGEEARMVYTDDYEHSWLWRLPNLDLFDDNTCRYIRRLTILTGRCQPEGESEFFEYLDA